MCWEIRIYIWVFLFLLLVIAFGVLRLYNATVSNTRMLLALKNANVLMIAAIKKLDTSLDDSKTAIRNAATTISSSISNLISKLPKK